MSPRPTTRRVLGLAFLALGALGHGAAAAEGAGPAVAKPDRQALYERCMALARTDPERAYATARAWQGDGGGDPAGHCIAIALLKLGQSGEAARRLEALAANARKKSPALHASLLGQAANAWLIAGKPETAYALQTEALKERPNSVGLLIDRSISLASRAKYWEALDDLNRAIDLDPDNADALVLRASAYRKLDTPELASDDIARALALAPGSVDALLERGIIRRLRGDTKGAAADWREVIRLAPDSPAASYARRNLERLAAYPGPPTPAKAKQSGR